MVLDRPSWDVGEASRQRARRELQERIASLTSAVRGPGACALAKSQSPLT
jgi:hypothetical protein